MKKDVNMKRKETIINIIFSVLLPILIFYLFEWFMRNPFEKMYPQIQFLNIIFFELLFLLLFAVFGSVKAAIRTQAIMAMFVGLADYFVIQFRSTPIMPWDILSIGTAASVAGNYKYHLNTRAVVVFILLLLVAVLCRFLKLRIKFGTNKKNAIIIRLGCIAASILLLFGYTKYVQREETVRTFKLYDKLFTPTTMSYKDGTVVAFLMEMKFMKVEKPSHYSADNAQKLLADYATDTSDSQESGSGQTASTTYPNIIVVMNEAFSDLSILDSYETNMDEIPFMRHLMSQGDNTISGYMDVSVLGGNTANTEFEFLTGDTMAFLPQGSIPYQQFVKNDMSSLASDLKSLGYSTIAMHPYRAAGWDRDKVYARFGFDRFLSQDDFTDPLLIRKYISDQADVEKIIELYEQKDTNIPFFMFNVTMQNHSSYTESFDNFTPEVSVTGSDSPALNNYLSLLKKSDESLEELITYFDAQEEPTVIVFFGDHQPTDSVVAPIYKLNGRSVYSLSEEELRERYKVPYIIHANFDIEEQHGLNLSANYLAGKVLDAAGIPKNAYRNYLADLQNSFPSISAMQVTAADGTTGTASQKRELLTDYQTLQYYHLFQ